MWVGVASHRELSLGAYPVIALVVGGVTLAVIYPLASRRQNAKRAMASGACWVGLANLYAGEPQAVPVVAEALSAVGGFYGGSFSHRPVARQRPIGGLLWIYATHIRWEPRIWLGRGCARAWELLLREVRAVSTERIPPALHGKRGVLHTSSGDVRFVLSDPQGFATAFDQVGISLT